MRIERKLSGRGRVFHQDKLVAEDVEYELTLDAFRDDLILAELKHLPDSIGDDVPLVVEVEDGRRFPCDRVDTSDLCSGSGEPLGLPAAPDSASK